MRAMPSGVDIQTWILGIRPYDYFEQMVERPGLLVLRAKVPVCQWQGLHLAMSDDWRENFRDDLNLLLREQTTALSYRASHPEGRDWFNLYTSGVGFGCWLRTAFVLDKQLTGSGASVRYGNHTAHIRLSRPAVSALVAALEPSPHGGVRFGLPLARDVRPASESQALWFWQWPRHDTAT